MMIPTYGLTHIALAVRDADRASKVSRDAFGAPSDASIARARLSARSRGAASR
jgi:hypothetical protein